MIELSIANAIVAPFECAIVFFGACKRKGACEEQGKHKSGA
jgi:hypothetical protein